MDTVNEKTTHVVEVVFTDEDGSSITPTAISVRIDDVVSGGVIRVPTAETPASSIDVTITQAENAMVDSDLCYEERKVTVSYTYESGNKGGNSVYEYRLKNLAFVS